MKKAQDGLSWSYDFVVMTSDTVVTCTDKMQYIIAHLPSVVQQKGFKMAGIRMKGNILCMAPAEVVRSCGIFSIIGLAMHEPAVMADSDSTPPPVPPYPTSASLLQQLSCVCHRRLVGSSSPAMARSAFDFCHYAICSIQQLPLQP